MTWGIRCALALPGSLLKKVKGKPHETKCTDDNVTFAKAKILDCLARFPNHNHKLTNLRDEVQEAMEQTDDSAQAYFHEKVWPAVVQQIENDAHVRVRQKDGEVLWKWQGL